MRSRFNPLFKKPVSVAVAISKKGIGCEKLGQVRSWLLREKDQLKSMTLDAEEFIPAGAGRARQICRSGYRSVTRRDQ